MLTLLEGPLGVGWGLSQLFWKIKACLAEDGVFLRSAAAKVSLAHHRRALLVTSLASRAVGNAPVLDRELLPGCPLALSCPGLGTVWMQRGKQKTWAMVTNLAVTGAQDTFFLGKVMDMRPNTASLLERRRGPAPPGLHADLLGGCAGEFGSGETERTGARLPF